MGLIRNRKKGIAGSLSLHIPPICPKWKRIDISHNKLYIVEKNNRSPPFIPQKTKNLQQNGKEP